MARPKTDRTVRCLPEATRFKPCGVPLSRLDEVILTLDELEALRLSDLQGLHQSAGAAQMGVSRQTFGRVVAQARAKVARALIQSKALRIVDAGPIELADPTSTGATMKIAVALSSHGQVSRHFGKAARFVVYSIKDGQPVDEQTRDNPHLAGHAHGPHATKGSPEADSSHAPHQCCHGKGHGHHHHQASGGCGCKGHGHGHQHRHGHEAGSTSEQSSDCGEHHGGWVGGTLGDCAAVITAGIGAGAISALRRAGVRPVVLDQPMAPERALGLFLEGRL